MRPFLCLFLCSVLLTTGASLECETCTGVGWHCSGGWLTCGFGQDTCATIVTKGTVGETSVNIVTKGCNMKNICHMERNKMFGINVELIKVECSKAFVPSGSLLRSLLVLLLMKTLL